MGMMLCCSMRLGSNVRQSALMTEKDFVKRSADSPAYNNVVGRVRQPAD